MSKSISFLQLELPTRSVLLDAKWAIIDFMTENFQSLVHFAKSCGFDVKEDALLLVCGTTKTASCIAATYSGLESGAQGSVSGSIGGAASACLSVTIENQVQPYHYDFRNDASLPRRPSATKFRWRSNDGRWRSNDGRWRAVTPTLQAHCLPEQAFCTLNL